MTGTDLYKRTHKSVPVIFEPPCICVWLFGSIKETAVAEHTEMERYLVARLAEKFACHILIDSKHPARVHVGCSCECR